MQYFVSLTVFYPTEKMALTTWIIGWIEKVIIVKINL
jgi:hypothetical protein